jgi:glycerophosphoryl diester phosphodiesterase
VPPIGFAHRGARAHARENTLEAFSLALRLGATGLESDAWVTADGVVVLDHDGVVGGRVRRRPIASLPRADLPEHIPTLEDLYATCGTDFELSLDVKDPAAAPGVVDAARQAGGSAPERLWMCHHDWELVATWRRPYDDVRLVDSTFLGYMKHGPERRAAQLADAGIDAVNLHRSEWSGGLTALFHRFDRLTFGWDCQHDRHLDETLDHGVDGVFSDHVDRLVDALARAYPA